MCTLPQIHRFVQSLAGQAPVRLQHRLRCGIQAFSLSEFSSVNAGGRALAANRYTGQSRAIRALGDGRVAELVAGLLLGFLPRSPLVYCSLDHSQFGPFCVAVLAVSLRKGRAIPVWCQVGVGGAGLMKPLVKALQELAEALPPDRRPVLVMDRWFCGKGLFELIARYRWYFIARAKYGRKVEVPWENGAVPVGEVSREETKVGYKGIPLRLVRSSLRPGMKEAEPWFLLTNLPEDVTYRQVLNRYAERFEIEECFKDMKWLQRLEWQQVRKPETMRALLLFVFLGWWILWSLLPPKPGKRAHPKHRLSWFRSAYETLGRLAWPPELRLTPLVPREATRTLTI
jgi:Transposase DDE domain